MSNEQRIRGKNTSLTVLANGQPLGGSMLKVDSFNWKPTTEITEDSFLGEPEADYDVNHKGYDLTFSTHVVDNTAVNSILLPLVAALKVGDTLPDITLIFITNYRGNSVTNTKTFTGKLRLIMTGQDAGDANGFVKTTFSAKCKTMVSE